MSSIQGIMRSKVQGWDPWKSLKRNPSSWSLCGIAKSIYVSYNPLFLPSATLRDQMRRENSSSFAHSENMAGTWKSTIWKSGKSSKKHLHDFGVQNVTFEGWKHISRNTLKHVQVSWDTPGWCFIFGPKSSRFHFFSGPLNLFVDVFHQSDARVQIYIKCRTKRMVTTHGS